MTLTHDVTPVFVINTAAPPGNVLPSLARLLIDLGRRQSLTSQGQPMMLKELPLTPIAPWMQSCPTPN